MNYRWFGLAIACLLFAGAATSSSRAESSWAMPNLNPFAGSSKAATPPEKSSGFKMPSLVPSWAKSEKKKPSQPSTWSKISTGTKEFFVKTKDVLTPWDNPQKKTNNNGIGQFYMGGSSNKSEKKSFFTSWLPEEEQPQKPRSVSEFLKQPRPTP